MKNRNKQENEMTKEEKEWEELIKDDLRRNPDMFECFQKAQEEDWRAIMEANEKDVFNVVKKTNN